MLVDETPLELKMQKTIPITIIAFLGLISNVCLAFDGTWQTVVSCETLRGALDNSNQFDGEIKDGAYLMACTALTTSQAPLSSTAK
jgi:hypothetical protein